MREYDEEQSKWSRVEKERTIRAKALRDEPVTDTEVEILSAVCAHVYAIICCIL